MSEIFILYRDVKVTAQYLAESIHPDWDDDSIRSKFHLEVTGPKGQSTFFYWAHIDTKSLNQYDIAQALWSLCSDAEHGSCYDFPEFCSELDYESDSIKARNIFDACADIAEKLNNIGEFDFGPDREFLDAGYHIHTDGRIYCTDSDLWGRPSEAIVLFDDQEIEATWEKDRAHPGGPSTARMGDGWIDVEHRMPIDDAYWTWLFSTEPVEKKYNISVPTVRLITSPLFDDDDYYLTI